MYLILSLNPTAGVNTLSRIFFGLEVTHCWPILVHCPAGGAVMLALGFL